MSGALKALKEVLTPYRRLAVALSGGVDSSVLLYLAGKILGKENVLALTARSVIFPPEDLALAAETAWRLGVKIIGVPILHLKCLEFASNPPDRCYHCKRLMYQRLLEVAREKGFERLADGTQADDLSEDRPGLRALRELQVHTPLAKAGLTKALIRDIARQAGLRSAEKPATPCLATRFRFGEPLTAEKLSRILRGERFLRALGVRVFRLRHQAQGARLELSPKEWPHLLAQRAFLIQKMQDLGFEKLDLCLV